MRSVTLQPTTLQSQLTGPDDDAAIPADGARRWRKSPPEASRPNDDARYYTWREKRRYLPQLTESWRLYHCTWCTGNAIAKTLLNRSPDSLVFRLQNTLSGMRDVAPSSLVQPYLFSEERAASFSGSTSNRSVRCFLVACLAYRSTHKFLQNCDKLLPGYTASHSTFHTLRRAKAGHCVLNSWIRQ
jgi:hypothetical protein